LGLRGSQEKHAESSVHACTEPGQGRDRRLKGSSCPGAGGRGRRMKHCGSLQLAFCSRQTEEWLQRLEAQCDISSRVFWAGGVVGK